MIIILCASLQEGQDKVDDDLIIDLVKTVSAIMKKKIKDPVLLASCQRIVSHCEIIARTNGSRYRRRPE